jgi:hypothetical protein
MVFLYRTGSLSKTYTLLEDGMVHVHGQDITRFLSG